MQEFRELVLIRKIYYQEDMGEIDGLLFFLDLSKSPNINCR